jgi:hypothetical protein
LFSKKKSLLEQDEEMLNALSKAFMDVCALIIITENMGY